MCNLLNVEHDSLSKIRNCNNKRRDRLCLLLLSRVDHASNYSMQCYNTRPPASSGLSVVPYYSIEDAVALEKATGFWLFLCSTQSMDCVFSVPA
ncbi:hypothetical protein V6N13_115677 [Hibiscus sabdariffa]